MRLMNDRFVIESVDEIVLVSNFTKGGVGSGNFGHAGRPGKRGGSAPGGGHTALERRYGVTARNSEAGGSVTPSDLLYSWTEADLAEERIRVGKNYVLKFGESEGTPEEIATKIEGYIKFWTEKSHVSVRVQEKDFDSVFEKGLLTQFDTGTSGGMFNPNKRKIAESSIMNAPIDLENHKRPRYGYLDVGNEKIYGEAIYGDIQLVMKDDVKKRSTMTVGNSLDATVVGGRIKASPLLKPSAASVSENDSRFMVTAVENSHPSNWLEYGFNYFEVQIQGPVTMKDVSKVILHKNSGLSDDMWDKLEQMGIEVEFG